jgi:DNA-binding response OmpR family regulator
MDGRASGPSIVILDLWLTDLSSADFVRQFRASRHTRIPILLLSAAPSLENIELDVDAILQKPAEGTALVRMVDRLVFQSRKGKGPRTPS